MDDSPSRENKPARSEPSTWMDWGALADLIRLRNQSGTLLLLWPTLWSLVLASEGHPSAFLLALFTLGAFLMRSAGVVLNDLADRSVDRQVARTKLRPLASGALGVTAAGTTAFLLLAASAGLLYFLDPLAVFLSPVAFALASLYPFSKRYLPIPQAVLGIAFGWGSIMAWAAVRNQLDWPAWLIYAGTIAWVLGYDTIYALQDRADDARIGVRSAAVFFGAQTRSAIACFFILSLGLLAASGWLAGIGPAFYISLAVAAVVMSQQILALREPVGPLAALALFKQHVWIGGAILAGIWVGALFP